MLCGGTTSDTFPDLTPVFKGVFSAQKVKIVGCVAVLQYRLGGTTIRKNKEESCSHSSLYLFLTSIYHTQRGLKANHFTFMGFSMQGVQQTNNQIRIRKSATLNKIPDRTRMDRIVQRVFRKPISPRSTTPHRVCLQV